MMSKIALSWWIALVLIAFHSSRAAAADSLCGTAGKAPLLDGAWSLSVAVPHPVPQYQETRTTFFIFRDGTVVESREREDVDGTTGVRTSRGAVIACGKSTASNLQLLNQALGQLRPGVRQSCFEVVPGFAPLLSSTWHGRDGRANRFTINGFDDSLPACEREATAFLQRLDFFLTEILAAPETQQLSSGGSSQ